MKPLYGKLEKEKLVFAPNFITLEKFNIWNAPAEDMLKAGYKTVVFTKPPEDTKEESIIVESWKETKTEIIQEWTIIPVNEKD